MTDDRASNAEHKRAQDHQVLLTDPIPSTDPGYYQRFRKLLRMANWKEIFETLGIVLAFSLPFIYYLQLDAMKQQLAEMQATGAQTSQLIVNAATQAKASMMQADLMKRQIAGSMAARINDRASLDAENGLRFSVVNNGRVFAPTVNVNLDVFSRQYPGTLKEPTQHFEETITQLAPTPDWLINEQWVGEYAMRLRLSSKNEIDKLNQPNPKTGVVIAGRVTFDDGFDRKIIKPICYAYLYLPAYPLPGGGTISGFRDMIACSKYKTAVDWYWKQRRDNEQHK